MITEKATHQGHHPTSSITPRRVQLIHMTEQLIDIPDVLELSTSATATALYNVISSDRSLGDDWGAALVVFGESSSAGLIGSEDLSASAASLAVIVVVLVMVVVVLVVVVLLIAAVAVGGSVLRVRCDLNLFNRCCSPLIFSNVCPSRVLRFVRLLLVVIVVVTVFRCGLFISFLLLSSTSFLCCGVAATMALLPVLLVHALLGLRLPTTRMGLWLVLLLLPSVGAVGAAVGIVSLLLLPLFVLLGWG